MILIIMMNLMIYLNSFRLCVFFLFLVVCRVTEVVVETLRPISAEISRLQQDPGYLEGVLAMGGERAGALAEATMAEVREGLGISRSGAGNSEAQTKGAATN